MQTQVQTKLKVQTKVRNVNKNTNESENEIIKVFQMTTFAKIYKYCIHITLWAIVIN